MQAVAFEAVQKSLLGYDMAGEIGSAGEAGERVSCPAAAPTSVATPACWSI
jgi:hypothetical protein